MSKENKRVYVIGVFDLFHKGHVELLRRAKSLGNYLIVAVNSDSLVASYKRKPYISEDNRLAVIQACKYVDEAFIIDEFDHKQYLGKHNIDIIVHGDDWPNNSYLDQIRVNEEFLKENKIVMKYTPYTKGISTSEIVNKIKNE